MMIEDSPEDENHEWFKLPYEQRLLMAEFIFRKATEQPGCSFRSLIYRRLGFKGDAYCLLYEAGGMTITNALCDYQGTE
jgi:hypothetical protein